MTPNIKFKKKSVQKKRYIYKAAAAKNDGWMPIGNDSDVNLVLSASSARVRQRVRQLVRDNPYFKRAISKICDFRIGTGIEFVAKSRTETTLNVELNEILDEKFKEWSEKSDNTGKVHFFDLQRLALTQECECGEYLFLKRINQKRKPYPFFLQPIEPDQLSSINSRPKKGNQITNGIETDNDGQVIAYHIEDISTYKTTRVPAEYVIHGFETLRAGQLTGISPFVSGVLAATNLGEYIGAEMDAAKKAAKILAIVQSNDPVGFQQARQVVGSDEDDDKIDHLENAIIEYLRPNESINFADSNRPGDAFTPFTKFMLRMLCIACDVPYELISGDYSGLSYSNLRGVRNDFRMSIDAQTTRFIRQFPNLIKKWVFQCMYLTGHLKKDYSLVKHSWKRTGQWPIDRLKDSKAGISEIEAIVLSPQKFCEERNIDYYEMLDEWSLAKQACEERGLPFMQKDIDTPLISTPYSLENSEV